LGDNRETTLVNRRDAVADSKAMAVHFHNASCRRDVRVAESAELVLDASASEERGSEYPRVHADGKGVFEGRDRNTVS
jgi:hypothetical protein